MFYGNALTNLGITGFGGLVRNHYGDFQFGFFRTMGWSIKFNHFLLVLSCIGKQVICLSYLFHAVHFMITGNTCYHHYANMFEIMRYYIKKYWIFFVHYTFCEGNACVDLFAKMRTNNMDSLVVVHEPLSSLSSTLLVNAMSVSSLNT